MMSAQRFQKHVRQLPIVALVACAGLTACLTVTVNERTAFAPPKRETGPATNVADLDTQMAQRLQSGVDQGFWQIDRPSQSGLKIVFQPAFRAKWVAPTWPAAMTLRSGFIGEGESRVAWTHYSASSESADQLSQVKPLVVHCAGNAGDRYNSGLRYAQKAMPWADVLVFDYPGYGDTPGPTSAPAFEASAKGVSDYVTSISTNRKLVFWGHSLGGFVCSRLAAQTPSADGLILETTAPNAAAVARAWTPSYARLFVRTSVVPSLASYDVVEAAAQVKGPILVLGATKDEVLPVVLARQVGDGLRARGVAVTYQEFPLATHQNVPSQPLFSQTLDAFFQNLEKPNP
jgi:pimeloyl-ACP methyl ester carboxylesterase